MKNFMLLMAMMILVTSCSEQSMMDVFDGKKTEYLKSNDLSSPSLIDTYTKMARWGDAAAYMKLAEFYHDGKEVKTDFLVSFAMLDQASQYGQAEKVEAFIDSLPTDDVMKMMMVAIDNMDDEGCGIADSIANALVANDNPDGFFLRGIRQVIKGDTIGGFYAIQTGAERGSSFAELLLCAMPRPGEPEDQLMVAERLSVLSDRIPIASMFLGDLYSGYEDYADKAAMCYQRADKYGLLNRRQADWLIKYYSQEGVRIADEERERLETLVEIVN